MSPSERRGMIRKENTDLSLTRQCKLLKISRSSIYYTPIGLDPATVGLMHEIDRIFTKYPFFGNRQIAAYLPQSCLVQRHYLHPRQERLSVSCSNHGLGDAQGVVLAAVKYVRRQLLR